MNRAIISSLDTPVTSLLNLNRKGDFIKIGFS